MAMRATLLLVLAGVFAGCGGGPTSGSAQTPKKSVEWFLASVKDGDWNTACARLSSLGRGNVVGFLGLSSPEQVDPFGRLKDCPGALKAHADLLRQKLQRSDPGATHLMSAGDKQDPNAKNAVVASPRGIWSVDNVEKPDEWRISGLPTGS